MVEILLFVRVGLNRLVLEMYSAPLPADCQRGTLLVVSGLGGELS